MVRIIPGCLIIGKQQGIIFAYQLGHPVSMLHIDSQRLLHHHMNTTRCTSLYYGQMIINRTISYHYFRLCLIQHFSQIGIKKRCIQFLPKRVISPQLLIRFGNTYYFKISPIHADNYFMEMSVRHTYHSQTKRRRILSIQYKR